jgi:hypothetical protein
VGTSSPQTLAQISPSITKDLRPYFKRYTRYEKTLLCPLGYKKVDLTIGPRPGSTHQEMVGPYAIWANWPPRTGPAGNPYPIAPGTTEAMERHDDDMVSGGNHYKVLMNDHYAHWPPNNSDNSSHPDYPRSMRPLVWDGIVPPGSPTTITLTRYDGWIGQRNRLDRNFLFSDGHNKIFASEKVGDPRMRTVPQHWGQSNHFLPPNE